MNRALSSMIAGGALLVAHALAMGPGTNPLGDESLGMLADWWAPGPCVKLTDEQRDDND